MRKAWDISVIHLTPHPMSSQDHRRLVAELAEIFYKHFAEQSSFDLNDALAPPPATLLTEERLHDEAS